MRTTRLVLAGLYQGEQPSKLAWLKIRGLSSNVNSNFAAGCCTSWWSKGFLLIFAKSFPAFRYTHFFRCLLKKNNITPTFIALNNWLSDSWGLLYIFCEWLHPAGIYLFKFQKGNMKTMRDICSKLTIEAPIRRQ